VAAAAGKGNIQYVGGGVLVTGRKNLVLAVAVTAPGRIGIVFFKRLAVKASGEYLGLTVMAVAAIHRCHRVWMLIIDVSFFMTGDTAVVCMDGPHVLLSVNGQLDGPAVDFNGKIGIGVTLETLLICQGGSVLRTTREQEDKDKKRELSPALFFHNFQHDPSNLGFK
jgi:hypothetical protein